MGKTSNKARYRYNKKTYDDIKIRVPKGRRADVEVYARENDTSVNALVNRFLQQSLGMTEEEWKKKASATEVAEEEPEAWKSAWAEPEKEDVANAFREDTHDIR